MKREVVNMPRKTSAGRRDPESGQGMAYVLVIGAVLLVFLTALVDIIRKEMIFIVGAGRRTVLIHQGDAAIDRAIFSLQQADHWTSLSSGLVPGYLADVTYTDIPGLRYTIRIQEGNWTPYSPALGPETTFTPAGDVNLNRTITVLVSNTMTGERKKIQAVVIQSTLNSAIYSTGQVMVSGSCDVHWGPVVSYSTASDSIPLPSNWTDHPIYMSKGGITLGGTNISSLAGKQCTNPTVGVCAYENDPKLTKAPIVPIDELRDKALAQNSDGLHYYGPTNGNDMCKGTYSPSLPANMVDDTVVFFDTCDGKNFTSGVDTVCGGNNGDCNYNAGACSTTNHGCAVHFSGGCGQGSLVVLGNLDLSGNGSCPNTLMTGPANCVNVLEANAANCNNTTATNMFWNGLIYVANCFTSTGTKQIYGTVAAYNTSGIGGNFSIYYKTSNATLGFLGQSVMISLWTERKPLPTDIFP